MKKRVAALALVFCFFLSCLTFARPQKVYALSPVVVVDGIPVSLDLVAWLLSAMGVQNGFINDSMGGEFFKSVNKVEIAKEALEKGVLEVAYVKGKQQLICVKDKFLDWWHNFTQGYTGDSVAVTQKEIDIPFSSLPRTSYISVSGNQCAQYSSSFPVYTCPPGEYLSVLVSDSSSDYYALPVPGNEIYFQNYTRAFLAVVAQFGFDSPAESYSLIIQRINPDGTFCGSSRDIVICPLTDGFVSVEPNVTIKIFASKTYVTSTATAASKNQIVSGAGQAADSSTTTKGNIAVPVTTAVTKAILDRLNSMQNLGQETSLSTVSDSDLPAETGEGSFDLKTGDFKLPTLGNMFQFFRGCFNTLFQYLSYLQGIRDLSTAIWSLFQGILQNMLTAIGNIAQGVWDFFQPTLENIVTLLKNMAHDIFIEFHDMLSTIASTLGDILSKLGDVATSLGEAIADVASETWDLFKEALQNILEGIGNLAEGVWEKFQDVFPKLQEALRDLPSEIWDPGNVDIDPTPLKNLGYDFSTKFPFSLPWDFSRIWTSLSDEGLAPIFEFVLPSQGVDYKVSFDDIFGSAVMPIVRQVELLLFAIGMIILTPKLLSGGGDQ